MKIFGVLFKAKCGCTYNKVIVPVVGKGDKFHKPVGRKQEKLELLEYCKVHKPNYDKRINKIVHKSEVRRNREKFLEERLKRKKERK